MKNKFDVDYFIKKFSAIPEEDWCVNTFRIPVNVKRQTKKTFLGIPYTSTEIITRDTFCAQGHCMGNKNIVDYIDDKRKIFALTQISKSYPEWNALINFFGTYIEKEDIKKLTIAQINNGEHPDYQQPTAKQRVLKALYDLKEKESKDVSASVISKDLILN